MATDPRKRQKKLERRAAKRKEKKELVSREQNASIAERMTAATRFPIVDCWIGDSLQDEGIGWVMLSRELPGGRVAVASFLVDPYCLGVKNAFGEVLSRPEYKSKYLRKMAAEMHSHSVPPADARKLLEEAVAYAHGLGLAPHPDYAKAFLLFGSVDAAESTAHFEFGKDGQPFFVSGPHDTPERCRQIVGILNDTCGPGRFHYLVSIGSSHSVRGLPGPDEEDFDGDEE